MESREYSINMGAWRSVFAVPSELVDEQLRMASGAQIKVILYLLRSCCRSVSIAEIARAAGISEADASDAITYWTGSGLLRECGGFLAPAEAPAVECESASTVHDTDIDSQQVRESITAPGLPSEPPAPVPAAPEDKPAPKPKKNDKVRFSYEECVDLISEKEELSQMLGVLEGMMGKQLNHTEIAAFVSLVEWHGLPTLCVAMLVEYCRSIGKGSVAYIEQTGIGWVNDGIDTVELADAKIRRMNTLNRSWARLRDVLGIPERKPSAIEEELSLRWIDEWQLIPELIKLSYDRCIDSKGKLSMRYMNGILSRWRENGWTSPEKVLEGEQASRNPDNGDIASNGRYAPTFDIAEMEKMFDDEWSDAD